MGIIPGCKWSAESSLFLLLAERAAVPLREPQPEEAERLCEDWLVCSAAWRRASCWPPACGVCCCPPSSGRNGRDAAGVAAPAAGLVIGAVGLLRLEQAAGGGCTAPGPGTGPRHRAAKPSGGRGGQPPAFAERREQETCVFVSGLRPRGAGGALLALRWRAG